MSLQKKGYGMLKVGKLDTKVLKNLVIDEITYKRPEIKTGAGIGEDCAVIGFGQYDCVISTDPITSSISDIGRLAIHVSCNDIASNGIQPVGITLAVMLPVGTCEEDISLLMKQAAKAAKECRVEIIGGHTEITEAVNQPVIVSTAFGKSISGASQSALEMKPGDLIFMTKSAGLEGTGIICSDREAELKDVLSKEELERGKNMLDRVSVVREGVICGEIGTSGMHDVTEGGVLGALWEMCQVSDMGAEVFEAEIPVDKVTEKVVRHYGIDCLRLISSGTMLIIAHPAKKTDIMNKLRDEGIEVSCIGGITEREKGIKLLTKTGEVLDVEPPGSDELYKAIR